MMTDGGTGVEQRPKLHQCFAPFLGLMFGAFLSWFAVWASGRGDASLASLTGRFLAIVTSLMWWALFTTMLQNRQIYGGGMVPRDGDDLQRTVYVAGGLLACWAVSLVSFVTEKTMLFWASSVIQMAGLAGEIGWKNPFRVYSLALGQSSRGN